VYWPITPELEVHDAAPDSKPGLASFCPEAHEVEPFTVSAKVVLWVADVPVPVIVMLYVPDGVDADVVIERVDEPPEVTVEGDSEELAPAGRPLADNDTDWAAPEVVLVETVALAEPPAATAAEAGLTDIEKSGPATPGPNAEEPFGEPRPVGPS
jgi:hypothetical protein